MKVITAIGNPYVSEKLKQYENIEIVGKDIQYQEGIIEVLEIRNDIELLIISNTLPEEYEFSILIDKIKKMKNDLEIIVFLKTKDENIENFLNSRNIYKIYYLDKDYEKFFYNFSNSNYEITKEINDFKQLILKNKETSQSKIIGIIGTYGVGKSIFTSLLAKSMAYKKEKILLIDCDFMNKSISTIFEKSNNKNLKIYDVDLSKQDYRIKEIFENLKYEYDFILIDICSNIKYMKKILLNVDNILFLIEPNLLELKKANRLLEILIKDFYLDTYKIKIIFNKTNKYSIEENILKEFFSEFSVIGNLKYDEKYTIYMNKNIDTFKITSEYEEIYNNLKEESKWQSYL